MGAPQSTGHTLRVTNDSCDLNSNFSHRLIILGDLGFTKRMPSWNCLVSYSKFGLRSPSLTDPTGVRVLESLQAPFYYLGVCVCVSSRLLLST